jgi:hypothetical protein
LPRALPDEKQPETIPGFHPFLSGLLIAEPFRDPVPASPTDGESQPLLPAQDTNSIEPVAISVEGRPELARSGMEPVHAAELASAAAGMTGRPWVAEESTASSMSMAVSESHKVTSTFVAAGVALCDQSAGNGLSGRPLEPTAMGGDEEKRNAAVPQGPPDGAPARQREIIFEDIEAESTNAPAQLADDAAALRSPTPGPMSCTADLIDVAPLQISGVTPERLVSAPAAETCVPVLREKKGSRLDAETSDEQEPRLAHGNSAPKQEGVDFAPAPLHSAARPISRTMPVDGDGVHPQAPVSESAVTRASAAPEAQNDNDDASSSENSNEKTGATSTAAIAASRATALAGSKAPYRSRHDDSSAAPGEIKTPVITPLAAGSVVSPVTVSPAEADQARMSNAPTPQNHETSRNPRTDALAAEISVGPTMRSEMAARPGLTAVEMARVIAKAGHSEMRIGLNTSAFGSVEVHTVVHANEVGVVIGSERGDLPGLIRSELPAISHNLQQHDVRLNQVNFQQQGFAFSADAQSGGHSHTRSFTAKANFESLAVAQAATADSSPVIDPLGGSGTELSILA